MRIFHAIKNHRQSFWACLVLTAIPVAFAALMLLLHPGSIYGAQTDWSNQHFVIPEYFRTRFYATHNFFPNLAMHLGGGQNIYNFAYYGLFNPTILLSYLFPFLSMATYLQLASIASSSVTGVLCYVWLRQWFPRKRSFFLGLCCLFAAPVLFHSHHHVMFVNYLPYLFAALILLPRLDQRRRFSAGFILACTGILLSSFFFSVGAFAAIFLYGIFYALHTHWLSPRHAVCRFSAKVLLHLAVSLALAAVLLIPVAMTLLGGRDSDAATSLWKILVPRIQLNHLLYSPFSTGVTLLTVLSAVGLLRIQRSDLRFLAGCFLCLLCLPVMVYLLNGTMYVDPKVLIPFLPLALLLTGHFLAAFQARQIPTGFCLIALVILIPLGILCNGGTIMERIAVFLDGITLLIVLSLHQKAFGFRLLQWQTLAISVVVCFAVNCGDGYTKKTSLDAIYSQEISRLSQEVTQTDDSFYRISNEYHAGDTVNRIWHPNYYRSSLYSSIHNKSYSDFYFRQTYNENSIRNAAMMVQSKNPVFGMLMGEKYILSGEELHRYGLQKTAEEGGITLYENPLAFPIGYATSHIMSNRTMEKLPYAKQLEAILENAIVAEEALPDSGETAKPADAVHRIHPGYTIDGSQPEQITKVSDGVYYVHADAPFSVSVTLDDPIDGLALLSFHVNNHLGSGTATGDVVIQVNGIRNKLTNPSWKYQNNNFQFHYAISSWDPIRQLSFRFSAGDYVISHCTLHAMENRVLQNAAASVDPWELSMDDAGDDTLAGNITVKEDGWFVLSFPYDKGFQVTVDGKETTCYPTDSYLMGFPIAKGSHRIVVSYTAPGFRAGAACSGIGAILVCAFAIHGMIRSQYRFQKKA